MTITGRPPEPVLPTATWVGVADRVAAGECLAAVVRDGVADVGRGCVVEADGGVVVAGAVLDGAGADAVPAAVCAAPDVHAPSADAARTAIAAETNPERIGPP